MQHPNLRIGMSLLAFVALVVIGVFLFVPPVPQDSAYYLFADMRPLLGIPNFGDVMSNLPFVLIGLAGLFALRKHESRLPLSAAFYIFFIGIFLTGFGSGWFHWAPGNDTLVWDRLPMTIAFMPFLAIILGLYIAESTGRRWLLPLLAIGVFSVFYWDYTESLGRGDLRPYALVQFLPMLLIPLCLLIFGRGRPESNVFWGMIGCYVLAKVLEALDTQVFAAGGLVSGHSLKHLAAAAAPWLLLRAIKAGTFDRKQA